MKNIRPIMLEKYKNDEHYERISEYIYKQRNNGSFRIAMACDLEEGDSVQYPLEDLLDKYYVNCTDYFEESQVNGLRTLSFELEGSLDDEDEDLSNIKEVSKIIGKHVYNGNTGTLIIE